MVKRLADLGGAAPALPAAMVAAGLTLGLAGCAAASGPGGSGSNATAGTQITASAQSGAPLSLPSATASGQGGGQGSGQGAGGSAGGCTLGELTLSLGPAFPNGAPGSLARPVILANSGSSACTVLGFPGVAALDGGGNQLYQASRAGSAGAAVTLQPGGSAAGVLYAVTSLGPSGSGAPACASTPKLLVTPPNETHSGQVSISTTMCVAPALTALSPGSTGGGSAQAAAEFIEAQQLWKAGANAISAVQGAYWTTAAGLLSNAASSGAPGSTGFAAAAQHLTELASLPDANQSSSQQAESHADLAALNSFFSTPGLYS